MVLKYPEKLPPLIYPDRAVMRLVSETGAIKWRNKSIFISHNIAGDYVAIIEEANDISSLVYGNLQLGSLQAQTNAFTPEIRWKDPIQPPDQVMINK